MPAPRTISDAAATDDEADLPVLEHVGFLLRRAQLLVFDDFCRHLASFELGPSEYSVLAVVRQHGQLRQGRLGELLAIKSANLSPLVQRMVERGLLARQRVEHDQRSVDLLLTPSGERLAKRASRQVGAHLARVRAVLGEREHQALLASLRTLVDGLSP